MAWNGRVVACVVVCYAVLGDADGDGQGGLPGPVKHPWAAREWRVCLMMGVGGGALGGAMGGGLGGNYPHGGRGRDGLGGALLAGMGGLEGVAAGWCV